MLDFSIKEAREKILSKEIKASELSDAYLDHIVEHEPNIDAYLEIFEDELRQEARKIDELVSKGDDLSDKPLLGAPIAIKDNILYKNHIASAASKMLENYKAPYSATIVDRIKKAGAIILGRTNMDEFAMGSSTENSAFKKTKNPHDLSRVPGGSSGGSAAAVGAKMAQSALGTDTGGSIRQPAGFCGVLGYKPSYGAVSRHGLIAMGSSLDQAGPIARYAEDIKQIFLSIYGADSFDATAVPREFIDKNKEKTTKTIGVPRKFLQDGVKSYVLDEFAKLETMLKDLSYEVVDIDLPSFDYALASYYVIMPAEVSTNLARFDGLRYGLYEEADNYKEAFALARAKGFGEEVKRRILLGNFVLSSGYADEYYYKAQAARRKIRAELDDIFKKVDIIMTPTTPDVAFRFNEKSDPVSMYASDIFTVPVNIAGLAAISVPYSEVEVEGSKLPLGAQFIAQRYFDLPLLDFAINLQIHVGSK